MNRAVSWCRDVTDDVASWRQSKWKQ